MNEEALLKTQSADDVINVESLLNKIIQNSHTAVSTTSTKDNCILHKVYTAGCYTNASYIISTLHPGTVETTQHKDTKNIIQMNQDNITSIYDSEENPLVAAIMFNTPSQLIIAFHGINFDKKTYHLKNFESELTECSWAPGKYHKGFLKLFTGILPKVIHTLTEGNLLNGTKKLCIYGHSMGGALAQLLTQYLQQTFKGIQTDTIVFGSPKVMCPLAVKTYNTLNNNTTLRVENPLDLAIYMPRRSMGYANVERSLIIPSTYTTMARNHDLEGYLESISTFKDRLAQKNIQHISLEHYLQATKRFNILYPFTQNNAPIKVRTSTFSEFIHLMTYNISKGLHSLINLLPFKYK